MKSVLALVLVVAILPIIYPEEDVPWGYHKVAENDTITNMYLIHEKDPHAAFLCPQGYFISKLTYRLILPDEFDAWDTVENKYGIRDSNATLDIRHAFDLWKDGGQEKYHESWCKEDSKPVDHILECDSEDLRQKTEVWSKHGPCGALIYCLGFQACIFRFSIELCRRDAVPLMRKLMEVHLTCAKQSHWNNYTSLEGIDGDALKWPEQTMHLKYKSTVEKGTMDLFRHTNITRIRHSKKDVFHITCPDLETAKLQGYTGHCYNEPANQTVQVEALWRNLGRTLTHNCSSQLVEVYCAYQYNASGHCSPPFLLHKQDGLKFNSISMPQNGRWPDDSSYQKISSHLHVNLIPARIGFAILGHGAADVLMDLLKLIYRPHHYYAFHIDNRAETTREELEELIEIHYKNAPNIRVIPKDRSVDVMWGGFGIQRAEMETFEELMRMGLWDHAYMISGSDLPLRDIDDFAVSLAPYRGQSFLRIHHTVETDNEHLTAVWHSCDGHVFKVGTRQVPEGIDFFSHAAFVLLSRSAVKLLLSADRPAYLNNIHFFMASMFVADESYFGTSLHLSDLKNVHTHQMFHFMGNFEPHTIINLCRHSDTTDACGQGPGDFSQTDLPILKVNSHRRFFARKFKMDLKDPVRAEMAANSRQDAYKDSTTAFLPLSILRKVASFTLPHFPADQEIKSVGDIHTWRIVSSLLHPDPSCHVLEKKDTMLTDEFKLWLDYGVIDKDGSTHNATATFVQTPTFRCYPGGSIRMMHITTRPHLENRHRPLDRNFPIPSLPLGGDILWLQLNIDVPSDNSSSTDRPLSEDKDHPEYLTFPSVEELMTYEFYYIMTDIRVTDETGVVRCKQEQPLEIQPETLKEHGPVLWFHSPIKCDNLAAGVWTITMTEQNHPNALVYEVKVNLLDESSTGTYEAQALKYTKHLWIVDDVMIHDDDVGRFYGKPTSNNPKSKTRIETLVSTSTPTVHVPNETEFKDIPVTQTKNNLSALFGFHIYTIALLLSLLLIFILSYFYLSWTCPGKKKPILRMTPHRVAALFGFVIIHQVVLYILMEVNSTAPGL